MDDIDPGVRILDVVCGGLDRMGHHDVAAHQVAAGGCPGGLPFLLRQVGKGFQAEQESAQPCMVSLVQRVPAVDTGGYCIAGDSEAVLI